MSLDPRSQPLDRISSARRLPPPRLCDVDLERGGGNGNATLATDKGQKGVGEQRRLDATIVVGPNPQPSRRRIDARGPSMLTDVDNITPELSSSSSANNNKAKSATSADSSGGDGGATPKNPFDSSSATADDDGGGGGSVSSPLHLVQADPTAAGCAAAVQLAAEELLQHVQQQNAAMASTSSAEAGGQNPFAEGGGGGGGGVAGDASVCSNASSFRSVPSVDTATLGGGGGGGGASTTSPRGSYLGGGGGSSSSAYHTPAQAQAPPPQPPYSCPPTTPAHHHAGGGGGPPPTSACSQQQRSPGNTPDLAGAASAIQMPALYLSEGGGSGGGAGGGPAVSSPTHSYATEASGVILGVQQLERQQADWEAAKRHSAQRGQQQQVQQQPQPQAMGTAPNPQAAATVTPSRQMMVTPTPNPTPGGPGQGQQQQQQQQPPTFLEYRQPVQQPPPPLAHEHDFHDDASLTHKKPLVVYGYLRKQTRNGVWQRRFFETDGECLTYYKSQKRTKLLATLDLAKVGEIAEDPTDLSGCTFAIQVAGRPYFLRAEDRSTCKDWVINLNRVREARIKVGRIKLVHVPASHQYDDLTGHRKESGDEYISRVVVTANRNRTSRLNDDEVWKTLYEQEKEEELRLQRQIAASAAMHAGENTIDSAAAVSGGSSITASGVNHPTDAAKFAPLHALARWEKRATNFQIMRMRLVRWARRIRMMRCVARERDVVLHPVGVGAAGRGDDPSSAVQSFDTNFGHSEDCNTVGDSESHSHNDPAISRGGVEDKGSGGGGYPAWIGKETQIHLAAAQGSAVTRRRTDAVDPSVPSVPVSPRDGVNDDDDERTIS